MTLEELVRETLTQKHRRLMQEQCKHEEVYSSSCTSPTNDPLRPFRTSTNRVCLDCFKTWHETN